MCSVSENTVEHENPFTFSQVIRKAFDWPLFRTHAGRTCRLDEDVGRKGEKVRFPYSCGNESVHWWVDLRNWIIGRDEVVGTLRENDPPLLRQQEIVKNINTLLGDEIEVWGVANKFVFTRLA